MYTIEVVDFITIPFFFIYLIVFLDDQYDRYPQVYNLHPSKDLFFSFR